MSKQRKFRKPAEQLKTLDKVLIILGIFIGLFITTMVVLFVCFQSVPDTLIQCVLGSTSLELFVSAWITVTKKKYGVDGDNDIEQDM